MAVPSRVLAASLGYLNKTDIPLFLKWSVVTDLYPGVEWEVMRIIYCIM